MSRLENQHLDLIRELPDQEARVNKIGEYYAKGERVLQSLGSYEIVDLLEVNVGSFDGNWKFDAEPNSPPDKSYLEGLTAEEVVSLFREGDGMSRRRLKQLCKLAEEIQAEPGRRKTSVLDDLGLSEDEVNLAIKMAYDEILEGDSCWSHVATLKLTAKNGWVIEVNVTYDDCNEDIGVTVSPA